MVLLDMNCAPPEFIRMAMKETMLYLEEKEKMQVHSVASTPNFH
jgi:hypothetical protein